MTIVNKAVTEKGAHEIFRSKPKLTTMSAVILGIAAIFAWVALQKFLARGITPLDHTFYWITGLSVFAVLLFCVRVLPLWREVKSPALTISSKGIAFPGKPFVAWSDITENEWHSLGVGPFTAGQTLVVKAHGTRMGGEAMTLACSSKEYFRLCDDMRGTGGNQK